MADVDEVIRAAIAAGELILRACENAWPLLQGAGHGVMALAARLASIRGGGGAQIPLHHLSAAEELAALTVPVAALGEVREIAEREGVQYAVAQTGAKDMRVLICDARHIGLFRSLRHLGHDVKDADVPPMDGYRDAGLFGQPRGTAFDTMEFSPKDAAWFCDAANAHGIPFAASDPRTTRMACQKDGEILCEEAQDLLGSAPAWEEVRRFGPQGAVVHSLTAQQIAARAPRELPLAAAERTPEAVLTAFRAGDSARVLQLFPGARQVRFVSARDLEERFRSARSRPLRVVAASADRAAVFSILNEAGRRAISGPVQIASVARCCDSLQTRALRAVRHMVQEAGGRSAALSITLSGADAAVFRSAVREAGLEAAPVDLGGGAVRFDVPAHLQKQAALLLRAAGISAVPAPRNAHSPDHGR